MFSGFDKVTDSAEGKIEQAPQIPETPNKGPSMDDLRSRLNEVFSMPTDKDDSEKIHEQDTIEQHPKEITLDDGTVVTIPSPSVPILHVTDTGSDKTVQPKSSKDTEPSNEQNIGQEDNVNYNKSDTSGSEGNETTENTRGLTEEQKAEIKKETGWPNEVVDAIGSMEEYEIYKNAGLVAQEVNGKYCLVKDNIDWDQKDAMGRTNKERAEQGLSPIDKDGNVIELHHIGQHRDSPLAELTPDEHRGKGNDTVLHNKAKESEIDRNAFGEERRAHWKNRAEEDDK